MQRYIVIFLLYDNVKLGLIDLPGFGESNTVNGIQAAALKYDVEHTLWIFRPDTKSAFLRQVDLDYMKTVENVIKELGITSSKSFLSIAVNRDDQNQDFCNSLKETANTNIRKTWNEDEDNKNFRVYDIVAIDKESAESVFLKALENLSNDIGKMDRDMLAEFKKNLDWQNLKDLLSGLNNSIRAEKKKIPSDDKLITENARKLRDSLTKAMNETKKDISKKENKEEFENIVEKIKKDISNALESNLFYDQKEYELYATWEEWASARALEKQDKGSAAYSDECNRLISKIITKYNEDLNSYYKQRLDKIQNDIANAFRNATGNFISKDLYGKEAIEAIYKKLKDADEDVSCFIDAFAWLRSINLDFRLTVYPSLYNRNAFDKLNAGTTPIEELNKCEDESEAIKYIREELELNAKNVNKNFEKAILEKDFTGDYICAALEHFDDMLIRVNEQKTTQCFRDFYIEFGQEIFENADGNHKIGSVLAEILDSIKVCFEAIESIQ